MSDEGPTVFRGRYQLLRLLARGGMADVYLARDVALDRPVAIKVLMAEFAEDPSFVERFRREAKAAANLNHPNIVGIYDWGQEHGTYYIVMEYVEGRSFADVLRSTGPLHPDRAAEIAFDVAAALSCAHTAGIVHRDVKLGNVIVSNDGQVKVADFGITTTLSRRAGDTLTQIGSVMGTATYFSPEQARGQPLDGRSDLYSLGVVLYELIVGQPPFTADSATAVAVKHVQDAPVPPSRRGAVIADSLEMMILKLLAKNPANRYPEAADLQADLTRYLNGARTLPRAIAAASPKVSSGGRAPGSAVALRAPHPPAQAPGRPVAGPQPATGPPPAKAPIGGPRSGPPSAGGPRSGAPSAGGPPPGRRRPPRPLPSRRPPGSARPAGSGGPPSAGGRPGSGGPPGAGVRRPPGSGGAPGVRRPPGSAGPPGSGGPAGSGGAPWVHRPPGSGGPAGSGGPPGVRRPPGSAGPARAGGPPGAGGPSRAGGPPGAGGAPGAGGPPSAGGPAAAGAPNRRPPDSRTRTRRVPAQGAPPGGQPQYDPPAYYYEEVHRSDTWKRTALMLIGLAALLSILGFLVVRFYEELGLGDDSPVEVVGDSAPTLVEVPDLSGLGLLEAENRVRELGLGIDLSYRVNTGVPENTVFSQVPPAGQRLEAGEVVSVTVSQGEIPRVPPVTGRNSNDARMILETSGYVVIEVKETNQAEAGIVVRQQPDSSSELIPGEAVTITVSTGPGQIFVPDVRGKTPIEAFRVLNGLGFSPKERYESSETVPEGAVIETEPIVGTPMSPQSQIIVIISDGLPVVAVPDVRGLLFDTGRLTLERSGLVVGTVTFESVDPGSPDISRILEQTPPPNQETQQGTIVNLVVGAPAEPEPEPAPDPEPDPTETTAPAESTTTGDPPATS